MHVRLPLIWYVSIGAYNLTKRFVKWIEFAQILIEERQDCQQKKMYKIKWGGDVVVTNRK